MRRTAAWFAFAGLFLLWWGYFVATRGLWETVAAHWSIAVAMVAGSYVSGSTPMGGGTVGFPVLVLLFGQEASLGRDFSFAIQSIGMTSASVLIWCKRIPLEWRMLKWSLLGSLIGTPLGVLLLAPKVGDLTIKLVFAVVWASFGLMHFVKLREFAAVKGLRPVTERKDKIAGLAVGLVGGATVASITGTGIDMLLYATLVTVFRADLKLAIPTSVVLMAFTSLVGITARAATGAFLDPVLAESLLGNWLAASPVVLVGAPIGALMARWLAREPTLLIVSTLCIGQFIWTWYSEWHRMSPPLFVISLGSVILVNAGFHLMYRLGDGQVSSSARSEEVHPA